MTDSMEEERESLWLEVEMLTGTKFFCGENPPLPTYQYSMQANEAIEELQELIKGLLTENGGSSTDYFWKVKMSHECIA